MVSSLDYKGVSSLSISKILSAFPAYVRSPTAHTTAFAYPVSANVD
jgi:hypothetical protein